VQRFVKTIKNTRTGHHSFETKSGVYNLLFFERKKIKRTIFLFENIITLINLIMSLFFHAATSHFTGKVPIIMTNTQKMILFAKPTKPFL
jgi:hypothetical protein